MSNIQLVENLYRLRKAHHYTQQEISDLLNISRQAYSNYETDLLCWLLILLLS